METWILDFAEGSREMKELLGGKGANVAEMTRVLGPASVPPGFTVTTEACLAYLASGCTDPPGLADQMTEALGRLERTTRRKFGSLENPLLVSVRSGARVSMPGMLDTVLNLGLTRESVAALADQTGDDRFAWDSYRRFVQMFSVVCAGVPGSAAEAAIARQRVEAGVDTDAELSADDLRKLSATLEELYRDTVGAGFPQDPMAQLLSATRAVFDSWNGRRAREYRRISGIPESWGTAVTVQQMVFGNRGPRSCSGVAFSRDEITGAPRPSGDFLVNAQGEDVVSGARTPRDLAEMGQSMPEAHAELLDHLRRLERHFGDMQDTEFTVEEGRLFMLQARSAKRPARAAIRFAVDAVEEGLLRPEEALLTIDAAAMEALLHRNFDPAANYEVLVEGAAASPGAAKGEIVFTAADAVAVAAAGGDAILVRPSTDAEDVAGFHAAAGVLTSEGGKASHAALVARGMGTPAVCGAGALEINLDAEAVRVGGRVLRRGDVIAIDGGLGVVTTDDVSLVEPAPDPRLQTVLAWADGARRLRVRANADTPADALRARQLGAEGIGLCRTEHMFMTADRQPLMRAMIMAGTEPEREAALAALQPLQQADFEGLFEAMDGLPVTIRLLDPPLHEFLPDLGEALQRVEEARAEGDPELDSLRAEAERVVELSEVNPMLGTRGVRLGLLHPEIYLMQARAIVGAAKAVFGRTGTAPSVGIMIPLVSFARELELSAAPIRELIEREGDGLAIAVGTMVELPRACFAAGELALYADFFSFGTNDLTQAALGFSRDDVESSFLTLYKELGITDRSPFESVDPLGVGSLLDTACDAGRRANPELELGVCGEHGGDPESIAFLEQFGLDYVSCSPFRVQVARIAAAQASVAKATADPVSERKAVVT